MITAKEAEMLAILESTDQPIVAKAKDCIDLAVREAAYAGERMTSLGVPSETSAEIEEFLKHYGYTFYWMTDGKTSARIVRISW